MIPPHNSLVKYDNPVLVSTSKDKKGKGKDKGKGGKKLAPLDSKPQLTQTEDILNSILPPREWTEDGQLWVQFVSSTPATRLDVINLQVRWDAAFSCNPGAGSAPLASRRGPRVSALTLAFAFHPFCPRCRRTWTRSCSRDRHGRPASARSVRSCTRSASVRTLPSNHRTARLP